MESKIILLIRPLITLLIFAIPMQLISHIGSDEAERIGLQAYLYGYSLITSEVTRIQMTHVATYEEGSLHAPMGQLLNLKKYSPADYRGVTAPNADTLYSIAWVDVADEPWVLSWPDMGKRFYLFPIYSLWMPVIGSPGSRTSGEGAQSYAITGPDWKGDLPKGVKEIRSPTRYAVILGRTYCDGTEKDYKIVNALQSQYKLVPLSSYGKPYIPKVEKIDTNFPFSMTDPVRDVINKMDISTYFGMMATLLGDVAPPSKEDAEIVEKMAKIGLIPGKPFSIDSLDPSVRAVLEGVTEKGFEMIEHFQREAGINQNGWVIPKETGSYKKNYLDRAYIAAFGWPANLPEDAIYPTTKVDQNGNQLKGSNSYVLHFEKDQTPPVNGFWSITMYDKEYFFYPNAWNKLSVSPRDALKYNEDGSLDLYFQNFYPGKDKEANWLPTPKEDFILMMRLYWSKTNDPSILPPGKGSWEIPGVRKVSDIISSKL